jgi:hypothetical protein
MRAFFCAALTALVTISSYAQTSVYVGPQIGLLGIGAGVEVDVGPVSFSGEASFLPLTSVAYEQSGTEFEMDTKTFSGLVMVNFAPTPGRFYIGAGVLIGGITADGGARRLRGQVEVGDGRYPATEIGQFNVAFEYDGVAPAAMIGLRGAGINVGLGVALTGKPVYTMTATGSLRNDAQFMVDLETETNNVQEHLDKIPLMPLLRIGWQFGVSG